MSRSARGFTLIEMIVAIVIIGTCASTMLGLMSAISARSAETLVTHHATTIANAYLQEALSMPFAAGPGTGARANLDDVADYNFTDNGAHDRFGNAIPGLGGYQVQITSVPFALGTVPANQVYRIDVLVTDPRNERLRVTAFKTAP